MALPDPVRPRADVTNAKPRIPRATGIGEDARRRLIEAALVAFGEDGLHATTTRRIARLSGQNIASIAYHFGSKEGLYLAVAETIVATLEGRVGPLLVQVETYVRSRDRDPDTSLALLRRIVAGVGTTLTLDETVAMSRFILREQAAPTAAFDVVHGAGIGRIHAVITALLAHASGIDGRSTTAVLRAHALMGTVLIFRIGRETLLRRTGWTTVGDAEVHAILATLDEHVVALVAGLRATHAAPARRKPVPRRRTP